MTDVSNVSEKFEEFVSKQLEGTLCRCYISVNNRNGGIVQKQLIPYLALNEADLSKIARKTTSIAMLPQCATTKKWLFDFDYWEERFVKEFVEDIHSINPTLEVTYFKTIHGYDHRLSRPYKFTDKSIFDGIETVAFLVNGKELYNFTLEDVSWSDRTFGFGVDLGWIPWIEEQIL